MRNSWTPCHCGCFPWTPALIPSHSKVPFSVCFWAPSWGPELWESRAQRAHNPIWQEMVGMPGYIHGRTHSPTWLAQRLLLKAGTLTSAPLHTNKSAINWNTLIRAFTMCDWWQRNSTDKDYNRCLNGKTHNCSSQQLIPEDVSTLSFTYCNKNVNEKTK